MSYVVVDVEADGPIPGDYSMVSFAAVIVEPDLQRTFYGQLRPISEKWLPNALQISGFSREQTLHFDEPGGVMRCFADWLEQQTRDRIFFVADNNGFDWQFINWYFHHFIGNNPFGYSSLNLNSLYKGLERNLFKNFRHLRKTPHTHNALDDAMGNAEALLTMIEQYDLKIGRLS